MDVHLGGPATVPRCQQHAALAALMRDIFGGRDEVWDAAKQEAEAKSDRPDAKGKISRSAKGVSFASQRVGVGLVMYLLRRVSNLVVGRC